MTRLMMGGGPAGAGAMGPGSGGKPRRENRRETWCPGAAGARKRPLLPNMAALLEEGEGEDGDADTTGRKSDGGALLRVRHSESASGSPAHKLQRREEGGDVQGGGGEANDDDDAVLALDPQLLPQRPSSAADAADVASLQARLRELQVRAAG